MVRITVNGSEDAPVITSSAQAGTVSGVELASALASKDPATLGAIKRRLYEAPLAALRDREANALVGAG